MLGLVALSLGLIFGELKIVNIAQGDLLMVGAYAMYAMREMPFLAALAVTMVLGLVLGVLIERGVLRHVYDQGFMATMLATWGIGIVLEQTASAIFSATARGVDPPLTGSTTILGIEYPTYRLVAGLAMCGAIAALLALVFRTPLGLRLRASIDNVEMASILGVSPGRMLTLVFALATALGVLAGALVAPTVAITPTMGISYLAPAFFAVLIAREGSLAGPVVGGVVVAVASTTLARLLDITVAQAVLFALLALLIAVKPQGVAWGNAKKGTFPWRRRPATPPTTAAR